MRNIALLMRRELGGYLKSPMGYVVAALVLFVDGLLFNYHALGGQPKYSAEVLQLFFAFASFMTMVAGVMLAMRLFAEERQLGTLTLLLTSPIKEHEIVLGKFLSALIFLGLMTFASVYMPALIFVNGKVSLGHIAAGYLGLLLLGGLALSVGMFASSVANSQLVAAILGGVIMAALDLFNLGASVADPPLREILAYLTERRHLQWQAGVLHLKDVIYFISGSYLFLLFSTHALKARRWR